MFSRAGVSFLNYTCYVLVFPEAFISGYPRGPTSEPALGFDLLSGGSSAAPISRVLSQYPGPEVCTIRLRWCYVNFITEEEGDRVAAAYGSNYDRLAQIKKLCDSDNLFHLNQNLLRYFTGEIYEHVSY